MRSEELLKYVASKRTAAHSLMQMAKVSPVLLEILVKESMEVNREFKYNNLRIGTLGRGSIFARYEGRFGVSGYDLEHSGYRRTFSRHKDYMLDNWMIKILPIDWPDEYKRRGTYYNTTPLGKVLAMKYWYKKNEPREIKMKMGRMVKIVDFKPTELLNSFFEYLPKLKKYSKTIKESATELELNDALKYAFPEIDINFRGVTKKVGIELPDRWARRGNVRTDDAV